MPRAPTAISTAAKALNQSAHTRADLISFARTEPQKATEYLTNVEAQLRKAVRRPKPVKPQSPSARKMLQMDNAMTEGFLGDGRMTLQSTLSEDNKTFNVEGRALNTDGNFDRFSYGSVAVEGDNVNIPSPHGLIAVTDPETKKVLASMPPLAVILPGEPQEKDGQLVHDQKVTVLMASRASTKLRRRARAGPTPR